MRLLFALTTFVALVLSACDRSTSSSAAPSRDVVLYSSVDAEVLSPVIKLFEAKTGLHVLLVGDTEATKTTGLVQRLLAEKDRPSADVFWASDAAGTLRLDREGLLAPYDSPAAAARFPAGWPAPLRATDHAWYGFARRLRVLASNTRRVKPADVPTSLAGLANPAFKGRVGMAKPQFGTTRDHMAALLVYQGEPAFRAWLTALHANGLRLYDANSDVVRALAQGEIDLGLTDADDAGGAARNGWNVASIPIASRLSPDQPATTPAPRGGPPATLSFLDDTLQVPNTAAIIKGAPHEANARRLIDFLVSQELDDTLAKSDWQTRPLIPPSSSGAAPSTDAAGRPVIAVMDLDWPKITDAAPAAVKIVDEIFK